jgi:hypothetical protein
MRKHARIREKTIHQKIRMAVKIITKRPSPKTIILVSRYLTRLVNSWIPLCGWVSLMNPQKCPRQGITEINYEAIGLRHTSQLKSKIKYLKIITKAICMIICAVNCYLKLYAIHVASLSSIV